MLPGADQSTLLFPGASIKPTAPVKFARSVCDVVRKRLGVTINVNLWRHALATKVAEMRGATQDGARLLGHAPGSQAIGYYVRIGSRVAAKWASEITDEVRQRGMEVLTGCCPSRRRSRKPSTSAS
jgi:integrase